MHKIINKVRYICNPPNYIRFGNQVAILRGGVHQRITSIYGIQIIHTFGIIMEALMPLTILK
jgi:hypothetical protein